MLMGRELRSGALLAEGSVELTPGSDRALVVADARFHVEGTFEVRCANQSGRIRERFGVVGPVLLGDAVTATVTARHAHPGEIVEVAAKSVTIADLNRVRIEAEVHEYDSGRVALCGGPDHGPRLHAGAGLAR